MATLLEIRDEVRQRADIQAETARYPDAELDAYINKSYLELYGLLARHNLVRDETNFTITADGSATYAVPTDWFATLNLFKEEDEYYRRLRHHSARERPHGATQSVDGEAGTYRVARVAGVNTLEMYPRPQDGTYILQYAPIPAKLSADTDEMNSVLGWEEFIIVDVAIKALRKENTDTSELKRDKGEIMDRIITEAEMTEMSEAYTVHNLRPRRRGNHGLNSPIDSANYRWYRNGEDY